MVMEPDCELRVEENSCGAPPTGGKSPLPEGHTREEEEEEEEGRAKQYSATEQLESERRRLQQQQQLQLQEQQQQRDQVEDVDHHEGSEAANSSSSEGLANLQNMIMKLNSNKAPSVSARGATVGLEINTVCKVCNRDMENKYFLHAHMMNEHGMLNMEEEESNRQLQQHHSGTASVATPPLPPPPPSVSVSLPQYPADLTKLAESGFRLSGLNIPCPLISTPSAAVNKGGSLSKLSDKPLDFPKNLFDQLQGLPRHPGSFLDQMKRDLGAKMEAGGLPLGSPLKRPSLDQRDPNKKPASLSRSYCEICKKELCNKYFMKTHMMKMHGIVMDQTPGGGERGHSNNSGGNSSVNCEVCKKEVSSRYFLKVHMASAHGLNEDGTPLREMGSGGGGGGLMNLFPTMGDFPPLPPPHMGEFSRLLMQQGEKSSLEQRLKELDRINKEQQQGHICSLCSHAFPDIVSLQVHIIKSHGALPPTANSLDTLFQANRKEQDKEEHTSNNNNNNNNTEDATGTEAEHEEEDIAEQDNSSSPTQQQQQQPTFPFPLEKAGLELLQRHLTAGNQFPGGGMLGPAVLLGGLPAFGAAAAGQQQQQHFQGLFNMFLSEMLKKVQKDTPPQTPPVSPAATPPRSSSPPPPPPSQERLGETTTTS
jgi:hypothetical protein